MAAAAVSSDLRWHTRLSGSDSAAAAAAVAAGSVVAARLIVGSNRIILDTSGCRLSREARGSQSSGHRYTGG